MDKEPKTEQTDPTTEQTDPTTRFDVTRQVRQEHLESVHGILTKGQKGEKLSRKDYNQAIAHLQQFCTLSEQLSVDMLKAIFQLVQSAAKSEMNLFSSKAELYTIYEVLIEKGITTTKELKHIKATKIIPKILPSDMLAEFQKAQVDLEKLKEEFKQQTQPQESSSQTST